MNSLRGKAVYYFCMNPGVDPVAHRIFEASARRLNLRTLPLEVDGYPVLYYEQDGCLFTYVRTTDVISHNYEAYLPVMNGQFADFDFGAVVNWHEGQNAPDHVLTVHTTGDVVSGNFAPANPLYTRQLMLSLERNRRALGLDYFRTVTEATHWSGIVYGGGPELIPRYPVPLVDVEIGSSPQSWSNDIAVEVVARALTQVFDAARDGVKSLLCVGGVHLEKSFAEAVLRTEESWPLAVSHIFANHWIVSGGYEQDSGIEKLEAGAKSVTGASVDAIVFHDSIKSAYKQKCRDLGERLGVPVFKHKALARPSDLPLW
jgi:D-tyrosyl-tRNA(Tyr) deacylase